MNKYNKALAKQGLARRNTLRREFKAWKPAGRKTITAFAKIKGLSTSRINWLLNKDIT